MTTETKALSIARRICPAAPLDLGIAHVVDLLIEQGSSLGIKPCESCDGSPGHTYPDPTIAFRGSAGAAWHAVGLVLDHGLPVRELAQVWAIGPVGPPDPPVWQLTFHRSVCGGLVTPPLDEYWATSAVGANSSQEGL